MTDTDELQYAGFWIRTWASIIDAFLLSIIILPVMFAIYGEYYWEYDGFFAGPMDFLISWVLPACITILFWVYRQATPGKMVISAKIVDAETGKKPTTGQCVGRYFAYIPSMLVFGLGFFWIAFDRRKQGWHDKLAGTVVVKKRTPEEVKFQT